MPSTIFYQPIDRRLLEGAIDDLTQWMSVFPLNELRNLPRFSPDDYNVPRTTQDDPCHTNIGGAGLRARDFTSRRALSS